MNGGQSPIEERNNALSYGGDRAYEGFTSLHARAKLKREFEGRLAALG
jgi:hypothetical protein